MTERAFIFTEIKNKINISGTIFNLDCDLIVIFHNETFNYTTNLM